MNHRALLGFAISTCLVACLGSNVTSRDAAGGVNTSLVEDESSADGGDSVAPGSDGGDADAGGFCFWYSWLPVATAEDNEYLLPANAPTNSDPGLIPANWDLDWARVELLANKGIGGHKGSVEECGDDAGWYFADGADGATATRYSLCPKLRDAVTRAEDFRLSARSCH